MISFHSLRDVSDVFQSINEAGAHGLPGAYRASRFLIGGEVGLGGQPSKIDEDTCSLLFIKE